jgi:hypothetical protein
MRPEPFEKLPRLAPMQGLPGLKNPDSPRPDHGVTPLRRRTLVATQPTQTWACRPTNQHA